MGTYAGKIVSLVQVFENFAQCAENCMEENALMYGRKHIYANVKKVKYIQGIIIDLMFYIQCPVYCSLRSEEIEENN